MRVEQVYSFVTDVRKQMTGEQAVAVKDAAGLMSFGDEVLSSDTNVENFFGVIYDMTAKSLIENRPYSARVRALLMDTFTFGAILRKIYVDPMDAEESAHWDALNPAVGEKGVETTEIYIVKPTVKTKIFSGITTFEVDTSTPTVQIRSAFRSAEEMAAFIDAIMVSLENSFSMYLEALAQTVYCGLICDRLVYDQNPDSVTRTRKSNVVVDLRYEYNQFYGLTPSDTGFLATKEDCNSNPDFYRFASKVIKEYMKRMEIMGVTFSRPIVDADGDEHAYYRHTPNSMLRFTVVSDFMSGFEAYLQSDVWHNDITKLSGYTEVPYWQGSGNAWGDTRKVKLVADSTYTDDGSKKQFTVQQDGVIAILHDFEAMGMTIDNERMYSVFDRRHEVTAIYKKADKGYFVDPTENAVIFVVADPKSTITTQDVSSIATPTEYTP